MGDPHGLPPPGGGRTVNPSKSVPDQRVATTAWAVGSVSGGRSFAKILEDEQRDRNIIELQISKVDIDDEDGMPTKPKPLTYEDLGEFLFDVLGIDPANCLSFNFSSGRYDLREIKFIPNHDTTPYLRVVPELFKNHKIVVRKQRQNIVRVTFKNVPLNVPDEEILNLCNSYGKPVSKVTYEKLNNIRGQMLTGSTRFVDVELNQGVSFENYYWLEGPLPGDVGKRIVVLHSNQPPQCSHCLRRASHGCPAMGNGKACDRSGTKRAKMKEYMESLKKKVGYTSLKIKHAEKQALMFPSLLGVPGEKSSEQEVEKLWDMDEEDTGEEVEFLTPIEERDRQIAKQKVEIESLKQIKGESCQTGEILDNLTNENAELKKAIKTYEKKLLYTRNVTEQKLLENISDPTFFRNDPHLVSVYSVTIDEEEFNNLEDENDAEESGPIRSRKDKFLANVENKLNKEDPQHSVQLERLDHIKNLVLEKVKLTLDTKTRTRSGSNGSKRRLSLSLFDENDRSKSRPRTNSPPPCSDPPPVSAQTNDTC